MNDHYTPKVLKALDALYKKLPKKADPLVRGCLVVMNRVCGRDNCRCLKGHKHRSLYLSRSFKGKVKMVYVPRHAEEKVKKGILNYKKTMTILDRLSAIHFECLKHGDLP